RALAELLAKLGGDTETPLGVDRVLVAPPEHARRPLPRLVAARSWPGRNGPPCPCPTSSSHFIPLFGANATKPGNVVSRGKRALEKEKNGAWQENNGWWGPRALSTSEGVGGAWLRNPPCHTPRRRARETGPRDGRDPGRGV